MKIEKTECNYQVTECDLKFGEQVTLDGELLIPTSILDKIRAEIEEERVHEDWDFGQEIYYNNAIDDVLKILDKYKTESEGRE